MKRSLFTAGLGALALLAGCAVDAGSASDEMSASSDEAQALSASSDTFVTVRPDFRKCAAPLCGGDYVLDVNAAASTTETYVNAIDYSKSGLDDATIAKAREAGQGELILKGHLGKVETRFNTRPFVVTAAYRGLPGVKFDAKVDKFYSVAARSPQIQCFAAPCPNETATLLNKGTKTNFDRVDVTKALLPWVDGQWVGAKVTDDGALVAGAFTQGAKLAGGYEKVLSADQVFLRLPNTDGPCPMFKLAACPTGQVRTYTRNAERCELPSACVKPGMCPMFMPACAEGYTLSSWASGTNACNAYACDPTFAVQ